MMTTQRKELISPRYPAIPFQLPRCPESVFILKLLAYLFLLMLPREKRGSFNSAYLKTQFTIMLIVS